MVSEVYEEIVPLLSTAVLGAKPKRDMAPTGLSQNKKNNQRFRKPSMKIE